MRPPDVLETGLAWTVAGAATDPQQKERFIAAAYRRNPSQEAALR